MHFIGRYKTYRHCLLTVRFLFFGIHRSTSHHYPHIITVSRTILRFLKQIKNTWYSFSLLHFPWIETHLYSSHEFNYASWLKGWISKSESIQISTASVSRNCGFFLLKNRVSYSEYGRNISISSIIIRVWYCTTLMVWFCLPKLVGLAGCRFPWQNF